MVNRYARGFQDDRWDDESSISLTNETLERDAAAERQIELESALEHDEHPLHDEVELETEEEEAAPTSEKRLKREIRAEAVRRLEEAARTEADFSVVIKEWDKLDQNRERRERSYEHLRGDLPLDYQAVSEPKLIPRWMNDTAYRQMMAGNFLDILFNCPYEMHQLTADPFISRMIKDLSEDHKEVLYFLSLRLWSATQLALAREQSDRNIRKLRKTIHKNLQRQMFGYLYDKRERGKSLTLRERQFIEEYSALAEEQGKDVVIRRENKTNRKKGKPPLMTGTVEGE
ncbi:sigma-70 family RNA polymerase sigma factor [Faecalibacterium sp. An77]|uniref:sigma-70 family RNA polymerase sigma factor n=1 Tax=Faecalibacterium sp. An77 TaxID=1965655 RepID=UPI0026CACD92